MVVVVVVHADEKVMSQLCQALLAQYPRSNWVRAYNVN